MASELDKYYRQQRRASRVPAVGLTSAGFTPATFEGNVFTPQKEDMSLLQHSISVLNERKERTDQQRANIINALGNLKLDPSEDAWKNAYADRIGKEIDSAAQFGDYSTALEVATKLAGEALVSPEVKGRERYYEQREEWLKNLETRHARGEIDSETLARAKAQNEYAYKDIYGTNGNIVGGSDWNPIFNPVNDINLDSVRAQIQQMITPSQVSTSVDRATSQTFLDANGKVTTDGGGSTHSEVGVTAQQWAEAYDAWMMEHPEAAKALEQKRQNSIWRYDQYMAEANDPNLTEEQRQEARTNADIQYKYLTDKDGAMLSPANYARHLVNPMFDVMAYKSTTDIVKEDSTLYDKAYLNNKSIAETFNMTVQEADLYAYSSPVERQAMLKNIVTTRTTLSAEQRNLANAIIANLGGQ